LSPPSSTLFPYTTLFRSDWNHWQINDWPKKLAEIRAVTDLPIWVTEVGVSSFGADEVQVFGLQRTTELLLGNGHSPSPPLEERRDRKSTRLNSSHLGISY